MQIKKRLTISNILMLIIPVVVIFVIAMIMSIPFSKAIESRFSIERERDPNAYILQQNIRPDINKFVDKEDFENLTKELQKLLEPKGYHLIITNDGEIISSNVTEEDKKAISIIGDDILFKSNSIVLEMNSASLVKNSFMRDGKIINIIAINSDYKPIIFDFKSEMSKFIISYIVLVIIISLIVVTITNAILSSKIYKKLIVPLELLSYGSEQIKNGNLDFEMNYDSDDEFNQVCGDFNEMRMRLKDSVEMQLKYEENRKQLVVGISHDLRTPLTAIKGYVEGLRDGVASTPEKQKKYLDTIYTKACDMDALVDSLFLFSKLDTGQFPFKFNIVNVNEYLRDFFKCAKKEFYGKEVEISFLSECDTSTEVKLDSQEMYRVLLNILDNSVKYNKNRKLKIEISLYDKGDLIELILSDNGSGVQEEDIPKLFLSFYRGDASRTKPNEGSGLGLAIAKHIIEAHDGQIIAYNKEGLSIKIILPKNYKKNI
ncbi:signal transduction histidine kinase [Clostridium saccharoperbutylacetonicum]|uniref:histidine kinase n=1 Tax=Clostridium saccharoperbutylacetonicum N1-4(HMT) TaxID=931276 RepID=M1LVH2_9CLOT|nr:HAMP domain-containing sensor histidine kinase [Clostridium saccharoperbutylacetonicum]AGF57145.1 sensor histidine kinase ResE [Clostridium saccharoperbutylacetonicum N1-4(HMT)]NRT62096.1 signal transduction histidine kinase [Clostridium saccharoperbutylacetonicum]NSB44795.1 signal transduction histidine kinase [Clostridium saccharoperbutylacetonicum]